MHEELTQGILAYLESDWPRYAIAIEGGGGSGKTRYIEQVLTSAVGSDRKIVRVSLFGVSSTNDFYERFSDILLLEGGTTDVTDDEGHVHKRRSVLKTTVGLAGSTIIKQLKMLDVTYSATAKMLVDLLCRDDMVLVFDDAECMGEGAITTCILGGVNDLVESRGQKVIFVTDDASAIPADVREKLVWKVFSFAPSPTELAGEVCAPLFEEVADHELDVRTIICEAAEAASCVNARAMIRSMPLIRMLVSSDAFSRADHAAVVRGKALKDIATLAFQASMGVSPTESAEAQVSAEPSQDAPVHERLARWQVYQQEQNHMDVSAVTGFFDVGAAVTQKEIDECLEAYLAKRYPVTEGTVRLCDALDALRGFVFLEDDEVEPRAEDFVAAVRGAGFSCWDIARAVDMNAMLRSLGFPSLADEELEGCARKVIDNDVAGAHAMFLQPHAVSCAMDLDGKALVERLRTYSDRTYASYVKEQVVSIMDGQGTDCGVRLAEFVDAELERDRMVLCIISPTVLVACFLHGDASSQNAIRDLARTLAAFDPRADEAALLMAWLTKLAEGLEDLTGLDRLGSLRREWLVRDIDAILAKLTTEGMSQ